MEQVERISISLPKKIINHIEKLHEKQNKKRSTFDQINKSKFYMHIIIKGLKNGNGKGK